MCKQLSFVHLIIFSVFLLLFTFPPKVTSEVWIYSVKEGDNLWNLTVDYLLDVSYLKKVQKLNNIKDPRYLVPGTELKIPAKWLRSFPISIHIRSIRGHAKIVDADTGSIAKAIPDALVRTGDTILTEESSSVILEFLDGTQLTIEENSVLEIEFLGGYESTDMTDTRLHLKKGRLETKVAPKKGSASQFKISTPVAVTSVRGTKYRISSNSKSTASLTEVLEGGVGVSSSGTTILIPKGFGTQVIAGHPPSPPIKLLDSPDISTVPRFFVHTPIHFSLPKQPKDRSYRVQIAETPDFNNIFFNQTFSSAFIRIVNLPDGKYQMRARGIDKLGLEGKNAQTQFQLNARPEPPFLVEPKPGAGIVGQTPSFTWSHNKMANGYHFQLADSEDFTQLLVDIDNNTDTSLTLGKPLPIGKYYWRVAAIDQDGDGPFSNPQMLRRTLLAPVLEASQLSGETLVISFRNDLPGQQYQVQISEDETFTLPVIDQQIDRPALEIPKPAMGKYFVRIRTINTDGFIGSYSSPQVFDVPIKRLHWLVLFFLLTIIGFAITKTVK